MITCRIWFLFRQAGDTEYIIKNVSNVCSIKNVQSTLVATPLDYRIRYIENSNDKNDILTTRLSLMLYLYSN